MADGGEETRAVTQDIDGEEGPDEACAGGQHEHCDSVQSLKHAVMCYVICAMMPRITIA